MRALFLGGDLRQKYACDFLNENNVKSEYYSNFEFNENIVNEIKKVPILILPIPVSKDDIHINSSNIKLIDIISLLNKSAVLFGGQMPNKIKEYIIENNINYIDFMDLEFFQIQNAMLSAEGAIYYAKQRFESSIYGAEIAILGFGRIGKILSYLLHSQGAKITVCARKDADFVWSKLIGFDGFKIKMSGDRSNLNIINNKYNIIFNTIPHCIMDEKFAESINRDTLIIDIASKPFGMDELLVEKYGLKYYRELGIPGRYAPKSAGEIIGKSILNHIHL